MAALLALTALSGCASVSQINAAQLDGANLVADHVPTWANGEPSGIPARSAAPTAYPSPFTTPPPHEKKLLTDDAEKRTEAELSAARDNNAGRLKAVVTAEKRRAEETAALTAAHDRMAVQQSGATTSN
jgi:hypothetical protein